MADVIARQWSLGVLEVELDESAQPPGVTCRVVINAGDERRVALAVDVPLGAFGVPASTSFGRPLRDLPLVVPPEVIEAVDGWVRGGADDRAILWLHLVKPYGVLGAVPWEDLQPDIGIPLLRLPDVLPRQTAPTGPLSIAVCASAPQVKGGLPLAASAFAVYEATAMLEQSAAVHFFVDEAARGELRSLLAAHPETRAWHVHDWRPPTTADTRALHGDNPWLRWMVDEARHQAFDAVHVVCHGYLVGQNDQAVLSLAPTPSQDVSLGATHLSSGDVSALAANVGAFVVGLSSPPGNWAHTASRMVADAVGAQRAGPVFLTDDRHGPSDSLASTYRLCFGAADDGPLPDPTRLLYVQPELLAVDHGRAQEQNDYGYVTSRSIADPVASMLEVAGGTAVSAAEAEPWVAVLARYVEEQEADLVRAARAAQEGRLGTAQRAQMRGTREALEHLAGIVDEYRGERA